MIGVWYVLRSLSLQIARRGKFGSGSVRAQRCAGRGLEGSSTAARVGALCARRGHRLHALAFALATQVLAQELLEVAACPIRHGSPPPRAQVPNVPHCLRRDVVLLRQRRGRSVAR